MTQPSIYAYTDCLEYLQDWFEFQKSSNQHFSFASFSRKAGFKSRSFIQLVLKAERKISSKSLFQIIQGLGLEGNEAHFFEALVDFRQAPTHEEKELHWVRIKKLGRFSDLVKVNSQEFDFFKTWYLAPLREIICNLNLKCSEPVDFKMLSSTLSPSVPVRKIQEGFQLLKDLKLIVEDENECWTHSNQHLQASSLTRSLAVRQFQKENNKLAEESLDRFKRTERNISTITLGTNNQGFREINQLIQEFQENVVKIVEENSGAEQVFQLNVQLFPVSKNFKGKNNDS